MVAPAVQLEICGVAGRTGQPRIGKSAARNGAKTLQPRRGSVSGRSCLPTLRAAYKNVLELATLSHRFAELLVSVAPLRMDVCDAGHGWRVAAFWSIRSGLPAY